MIVSGKIINEVSYEIVALAGHHKADREAGWMSGWSDKVEASQGAQVAFASEVKVQNDTYPM